MKKFYVFMAALAMGLCITSCGDDDDNNGTKFPDGTETFSGLMTVTFQNAKYETDNTVITMTPEAGDTTVTIAFSQVQFVPQMPMKLDITVPGVSAVSEKGGLSLSGDDIIPFTGNVPFPVYTVSGLTGRVKDGEMTLSLTFGKYPLTYTGKEQ